MGGNHSWLWLLVASSVVAQPAKADVFTTWRRASIDFCQRLPTVEEVDALEPWHEATGLDRLPELGEPHAPSYDFFAVLESCSRHDDFASVVGLMLDDFILPTPRVPSVRFRGIRLGRFEHFENETDTSGEMHYYWYAHDPRRQWRDCLAPDGGVPAYQPRRLVGPVQDYLDKAYDPWWIDAQGISPADYETDSHGGYVWVCRWTATVDGAEVTASLANPAETQPVQLPNGAVRTHVCRESNVFPCGCGPNLRWCLPMSSPRATGNDFFTRATRFWLEDQIGLEGRKFVAHIVKNDRNFLEILGAHYAYRTTRLQHFYDLVHRAAIDPCDQLVDVGQADECSTGSQGTAIEYLTFDDDHETPDWQVIELPRERRFERGGLLTTFQLLNRQPTEPNFANRVYSYFLCEDIGWRSQTATPVPATASPGENPWLDADGFQLSLSTGPVAFSPLRFTRAAHAALGNDSCRGCHVTVNPLAAFRNAYDYNGVYSPNTEANGILFGVAGEDIVGRNTATPGLSDILKSNGAVAQCLVNRSFHRLVGEYLPRNSQVLRSLTSSFMHSGYNMRELLLQIANRMEYRRPN